MRDLDEADILAAITHFFATVFDNKAVVALDVETQQAYSRQQDEPGIIGTGRIVPELAKDYFEAIDEREEASACIPERPFLAA